jgi:flagellar rod assembly protein/muramidase FlgJ
MTPQAFVALLSPPAVASMQGTNIPAGFVIAEGALESGWGTSGLANQANNLFGVKADASWTGDTLSMPTKEFINGQEVTVQALWRKYATLQDCFDDHAQFFIVNPRYAAALVCGRDSIAFANAVQAAGYATDPLYAQKLTEIINAHNLTQFDAA